MKKSHKILLILAIIVSISYLNYFIFSFELIQNKINGGKLIFEISKYTFFVSFAMIFIIDFIYLIKTKK